MRFLFVDKITKLGELTIDGEKTFALDCAMQYAASPGAAPEISPAAVSEAIGQLVSWLCLRNNDVTARPVFLFADRIAIKGTVRPGELLTLSARIEAQSAEDGTFVFSGEARRGADVVHLVERCSGYYMPLAELEDPTVTRERLGALSGGGLVLTGDGAPYAFATLAGATVEVLPGDSIKTRKTFTDAEPFYQDHFPRFPVTPIVMVNEMIGQTAARLLGARVKPRSVEAIKIRNFIRPGETVETRVKLLDTTVDADGARVAKTVAEVVKDGKIILRGRYTYCF